MSKTLMNSVAMACLMAACATPAVAKATLYQIVPVPNATLTTVFGINDSQVITGSWYDSSGVEHGYVGSAEGGNYTLFDDPTPGTEPRGLDDNGDVGGFANSQAGKASKYIPFERSAAGTIQTVVDKSGNPLNFLIQGFNTNSQFAGGFVDTSDVDQAYSGKNAKESKLVRVRLNNAGTGARGIDAAGDIVGWYLNASGIQNGFVISAGTATNITYPASNEYMTVMEGINDNGIATGQWTNTSGIVYSFTYNIATGKFRTIKIPGAKSFTQAWGINNRGEIAVGSDAGYYIYCTKSTCPGTGAIVADDEEIGADGFPCMHERLCDK